MSPEPRAAGIAWQSIAVVAALFVTLLFLFGLKERDVAFDLADVYVPAAHRVLDGDSPYPALDDPVWIGHQAYVYPPLTALIATPLTLLSNSWLRYSGALGALAVLLAALWVAGLRDPRSYAVFALWPSTLTAWQNANVTVLLVLAVALVWRFRDRWEGAGTALGFVIALKLLLWPLLFWLAAMRRIRAAVASVLVAAVVLIASWAVIGFAGFTSYVDITRMITEVEGPNGHGLSIYAGVLAFGLPSSAAYAASFVAGAALLAGSFVFARRRDDRASFTLALVAVLAFTPLVWMHYLTLLAIPLAIYRPRFSAIWALPWLMWATQLPGWPFEPRRMLAFVIVIALVWRLLASTGEGRPTEPEVRVRAPVPAAEIP